MTTKKRLIDANALIKHLERCIKQSKGLMRSVCVAIKCYVEQMPSEEVVHGRWEEWWPGISLILTGEEMLYRCSVCDAKFSDIENMRFCSCCGAKMDGDGNG